MQCWQSCHNSFHFKNQTRFNNFVCCCHHHHRFKKEWWWKKNDKLIPLSSCISIFSTNFYCSFNARKWEKIVFSLQLAFQKEFFWHLEWIIFFLSLLIIFFHSSSNIETKFITEEYAIQFRFQQNSILMSIEWKKKACLSLYFIFPSKDM